MKSKASSFGINKFDKPLSRLISKNPPQITTNRQMKVKLL